PLAPLAPAEMPVKLPSSSQARLQRSLTRQVSLVTTSDRLQVPPIAHFCQLVRQARPPILPGALSVSSPD
ncbi:MAG: hypothetical protein ACKO5Q_00595, partial [Microcystaceae cyanobacterium]